MKSLILVGTLATAATVAHAEHVSITTGEHPNYSRIVLHTAAPAAATITERRNRVEITLTSDVAIVAPQSVPRNVVSFQGGHDKAVITIVGGARIKQAQSGNMIIIDVLDPQQRGKRTDATAVSRPNPLWIQPRLAEHLPQPPAPSPLPVPVATAAPTPAAEPAMAPEPAATPIAATPIAATPIAATPIAATPIAATPIAATSLVTGPVVTTPAEHPVEAPVEHPVEHPVEAPVEHPVEAPPRASIHLAAGPDIGVAAFRRGDQGVVVFDDTVTADSDPAKAETDLKHLQGGTILTVKLAADETLAVLRDDTGWLVHTATPAVAPHAVSPHAVPPPADIAPQSGVPDGIAFKFGRPGRTMTISDPQTGQLLLLGTVRQAGTEASLIDPRRTAPGYVLLPTWVGLAVEVAADALDLRVSATGFTLQIPDRAAPGTAATATRDNQFQIPTAPTPVLMRQLDAQIVGAATAAPRTRGHERLAAARTMLALGLAQEAQALLALAANDDPAIAADPQAALLQGVAAILAGRPAEAAGLDSTSLPATADVAMWRGIRDAAQGKPAPMLGDAWPTLSTYPDAIRQRIAPTVLEAAVGAGANIPPAELQAPSLAMARARMLEKTGDTASAIDALTALAAGRDEQESVRATLALTELRLSQNQIKPADAAETLERQAVHWRGDQRELEIRFRAAELRRQADQWRAALDLLRETETLFPQTKDRVAAASADTFKALLAAKEFDVKPLDLVTIAGDYADRLPSGEDGEKLAALLADKLAALDLPSRAIPVLKRLSEQTTSPKAKAAYALRLAQLQLDGGDTATIEASLSALTPDLLSPDQTEQRLLLIARARAARGDPAGAAESLASVDDPAGIEARAGWLAKAGDWRGSLTALKLLTAKSIPATGTLTDPQQDLVLRVATAAVHAADPDALKQLHAYDGRLTSPRSDLFKVLTATAVESPDDLPRAARELAMTRTVPERLSALKSR